MEYEISSIKFELYSYYKQFKDYVPKPISNTYDRFLEETTEVPSGASAVRVLLKCPSEVFCLHFYLFVNNTAGSDQITSVKLEGPSSELFDLNYAMNYLLSSEDSADNSSVFSIQFGPRHGEGDFIVFGQSMSPTYATVTFPPSASDRTLYTQSEFRSKISGGNKPYQDISGLFTIN
ncbi:hypothetical protein BASA81_002649 [Batrachochytrium salamandrivorans]|nr:hypothetical protein BASA81_002649 [Batrachochytrium salamandrivorans]